MKVKLRRIAMLIAAAALLPAGGASAQWYSSAPRPAPLYPYAAPAHRPYAVEVAPNTYVIHRPSEKQSGRRHAHAQNQASTLAVRPRKQKHSRIDPALIAELRKRPRIERAVVNNTRPVKERPVAKPEGSRAAHVIIPGSNDDTDDTGEERVISADAEVTILGPDRMSIRLFRKGTGPKAEAPPDAQ